ncbi:MAG: aldo/keto reductase, partial [Firmicutes bacterium]|nr:aldo/keto reductase [Bacillota bacterium]
TWLLEKADDFDRYLEEQLGRLGLSSIDFYLFHALDRERWTKVRELGALRRAEKALADGRIGHLGFSFHDGFESLKDILDGYDGWEFCQIQYNYLDTEFQAGTRGLRYAAAKGLGVVVMEPVRGGLLASPPEAVRRVLEAAPVGRSPAEWALQWVWNHPEVSLALSGMSTMEQVAENVGAAACSGPGTLTPEELAVLDAARAEWLGTGWIPCTGCGYCRPCPQGVDIPSCFDVYNRYLTMPGRRPRIREWYSRWPQEKRAESCAACGQCRDRCPQHLAIPDLLAKVHELLGEDTR